MLLNLVFMAFIGYRVSIPEIVGDIDFGVTDTIICFVSRAHNPLLELS